MAIDTPCRSSSSAPEAAASQRASVRVYVGIAALVALVAAGAVWLAAAFGVWVAVIEAPTLLLLLIGFSVQIHRNADPRWLAKRRACAEARADAWMKSEDPKTARRALRPWIMRT
jgi:hypothetical protein